MSLDKVQYPAIPCFYVSFAFGTHHTTIISNDKCLSWIEHPNLFQLHCHTPPYRIPGVPPPLFWCFFSKKEAVVGLGRITSPPDHMTSKKNLTTTLEGLTNHPDMVNSNSATPLPIPDVQSR